MKRTPSWLTIVISVAVAGALAAGQALAEKPAGAGGGKKSEQGQTAEHGKADKDGGKDAKAKGDKDSDAKGGGKEAKAKGDKDSDAKGGGKEAKAKGDKDSDSKGGKAADKGGGHFNDDNRYAVREYFDAEFRSGKCPPGLAKKNNGCMPPGLAKKWSRGQSLPADVVVYELPVELSVRIGVPPVGHKFVRVASDILLIAVGTNMVVDAIEDLGRL